MRELVTAMEAGEVQQLFILGGNPVHDAPADLDFACALERVPLRVHLSPYEDETSRLCHWHLPEAHFLESWSDARTFDGTASIVQPLIAPLHDGRSAHELVAALAGDPRAKGHELVRAHWREEFGADDDEAGFEARWRACLHDGVVAGTAFPALALEPRARIDLGPAPARAGLELVLRPDPSVWDGRFAGNGWLQELPRPITRIVWDNAALIAPAFARERGIENGTLLALTVGSTRILAPALCVSGHPEDAVTLHLGYGRKVAGRVGTGVGFDAYPIRVGETPWTLPDLQVEVLAKHHALACVQEHQRMEGRDILRVADYGHPAGEHAHTAPHDASLYPEHPYEGHAWAMVIDATACIGCNACMIACQAENNVPVVGKREVERGREMHWLRVDVYVEDEGSDEGEDAAIHHQPVPCMHCENAPCEVVCPVGATVHSPEGLNEMVYNRCVGTRYCSNNCPYKVRRFNFFQYADDESELLALGRNPDVTVRTRGVMEKCTYCVQRINRGRMQAEKEGRPLADGEIVTACQQACPTRAIAFGDKNDAASEVARLRTEPHHYALLAELGTKPRTTYLARLRNPWIDEGQPR
jgi:molybdopterin-containing oxidoreductase family iron-sulfur binding subunit